MIPVTARWNSPVGQLDALLAQQPQRLHGVHRVGRAFLGQVAVHTLEQGDECVDHLQPLPRTQCGHEQPTAAQHITQEHAALGGGCVQAQICHDRSPIGGAQRPDAP